MFTAVTELLKVSASILHQCLPSFTLRRPVVDFEVGFRILKEEDLAQCRDVISWTHPAIAFKYGRTV